MPKDDGIGAATTRREDVRFLTGKGRYTDDINVNGQAHVCFLRSQVAHGRIVNLDSTVAQAIDGVIRIFTGDDFAGVGGLPCGWCVTDRFGQPMQEPPHPVLAQGKVRHVGDPVAAVIAETLDIAREAAELIDLEIEELPAVVDMESRARGQRTQGSRRVVIESLLRLGFHRGQSRGRRCGDRRRTPCDDPGADKQSPCCQRDGTTGQRSATTIQRPTSTRSTRRVRTRTSSGS